MESGIDFVAADMPNADRFMLHVYAAMAEEEGRRISERTKAALAAAKERGVELGKNGKELANKNKAAAIEFANSIVSQFDSLGISNDMDLQSMANILNDADIKTRECRTWTRQTVSRVLARTSKFRLYEVST